MPLMLKTPPAFGHDLPAAQWAAVAAAWAEVNNDAPTVSADEVLSWFQAAGLAAKDGRLDAVEGLPLLVKLFGWRSDPAPGIHPDTLPREVALNERYFLGKLRQDHVVMFYGGGRESVFDNCALVFGADAHNLHYMAAGSGAPSRTRYWDFPGNKYRVFWRDPRKHILWATKYRSD